MSENKENAAQGKEPMILGKGNYFITIDTGIGKPQKTMIVNSTIQIETFDNGLAIPVSDVKE